MTQLAKYISRNTILRSIAALSIRCVAGVTASAQTLTLDDFSYGHYVKVLNPSQPADTHFEALPPKSPLGAARETVFTVGAGQYAAQPSILSIGKGICVVDAGFQENSPLQIVYGFNLSGDEVPLGLNLSAYSGLQVNFAGIATDESLYLILEIAPSSGGTYVSEVLLPSSATATGVLLPYTSFTDGSGAVLTQAEARDISYIEIQAGAAWSSFGITSLQAAN
jgi:hypothetical protein